MNVLILGAGRVGSETAKILVNNACNVTLVDTNIRKLLDLQSAHDLRTVRGNAAAPEVLRQANGDDADIVIAVTAIDEVNLVACKICALLFKTPTKIARIRGNIFDDGDIGKDGFDIDHVFCPEQIVADGVGNAIKHPGCQSVHKFGGGQVALATIRISSDAALAGQTIGRVRAQQPELDFRMVSVYRDDQSVVPEAETRLYVGDEVSVIIAEKDIDAFAPMLSGDGNFNRRVFIAGGGNIGLRVARAIEDKCETKILEINKDRCRVLAQHLRRTLVLKGGATDEELLREENIANTDIYCALTNDEEENILSAMLAKRSGAKKVIALVGRPGYVNILKRQLDVVVSPSESTIGSVLAHIRLGDVSVVHSLHSGSAEAIEAVIHGDKDTSPVVGRAIADIAWPEEVMPGAVIRGGELKIAHDGTVIESGDKVILFVSGKEGVRQTEKLLQVGVDYF